jgi:uncharacterized protein YegJ (DUF2314 family)
MDMKKQKNATASYTLDNGVEMHLAAPDTFYLPPELARTNLNARDIVKLVFRIEHDGELHVERMWVQVVTRTATGYRGVLDNDPYCTDQLKAGVVVEFGPEHVIQICQS